MSSRSERTVFRTWGRLGWIVSALGHAGMFGALVFGVLTGRIGSSSAAVEVSVVEMEAAPPPPKKEEPPPPPPPPPPPKEEPPAPKEEPVAPPEPAPEPPPVVNDAPPIATGEGEGGGDGWVSGHNKDFGGSKPSAPKQDAAPPKKEAVPAPPPPPPAPVAPRELDESELSVKPNIRCSPGRIAALYPQAAIDNDAEADIPVEVVVDATGRITKPHARIDPGFGLKEAAEQALVLACRPSAIPRDAAGNLVAARVVHTLRFQLE